MKYICAVLITFLIPSMLLLTVRQAWAYNALEREITAYNEEQHRLISENKRKISGISVLSKPQRIEKIAIEELEMRKAYSSEIIRISLPKKG
ncbi:MAG: cell division protein FtsL [Treponema sp.]